MSIDYITCSTDNMAKELDAPKSIMQIIFSKTQETTIAHALVKLKHFTKQIIKQLVKITFILTLQVGYIHILMMTRLKVWKLYIYLPNNF